MWIDKNISEICSFLRDKIDVDYCICGSWLNIEDCCSKPLDESIHWYLNKRLYSKTIQSLAILERKNWVDQEEYGNKIVFWLYEQLSWLGLFSNCICKWCIKQPIQSHLFSRAFLRDLYSEGYKFDMSWVSTRGLWPDSFKMKLLCIDDDTELFKDTDSIWDVRELFTSFFWADTWNIENCRLMWEFWVKTFLFKLKTDVLQHMRFFYQWLLFVDFDDTQARESYLQWFISSYKNYQLILSHYYNDFFLPESIGVRMMNFRYINGKSWVIAKKEWYTSPFSEKEILYVANVKFIETTPVYIFSLLKDWIRVCFIGTTVNESLQIQSDQYLSSIYEKMNVFQKNSDLWWAFQWVNELAVSDNPIFYIMPRVWYFWTTYIHWNK